MELVLNDKWCYEPVSDTHLSTVIVQFITIILIDFLIISLIFFVLYKSYVHALYVAIEAYHISVHKRKACTVYIPVTTIVQANFYCVFFLGSSSLLR